MNKIKSCITYILFFILFVVFPASASCPTLGDYINDGVGENFILLPVFRTIVDACSSVAETSWRVFALPLQVVIAIGSSIYIAVYTLKNISSFSGQDTFAYLSNEKKGVIPLMAKMAFIMILLTNDGNTFIYQNVISPVIATSMNMGTAFSPTAMSADFSDATNVRSLLTGVVKKIQDFNESSYTIVAMGRELVCLAFLPDSFFDTYWSLLPFGFVVYIMGWLICIGIAFYLLDVLFRLAVGCILLPMAIACMASKFTVEYTGKAWALFVNVSFNFIVLGLAMNLSIRMLEKAIGGNGDTMKYLTGNAVLTIPQVDRLVNNLSPKGFILTSLCCMLIFRVFTEIEATVDGISGQSGSVGKTGQKMGAEAMKAVAQPAKTVGQHLAKGVAKTAKDDFKKTRLGKALENAADKYDDAKLAFRQSVKNFFRIKD